MWPSKWRICKTNCRNSAASMPIKNPDAILIIILAMTHGIGAVASVIGDAGRVVFGWIAIMAGGAILIALSLFVTSRGLFAQQPWAHIVAAILMTGLLPVSLVSLLSIKSRRRIISGLFVAGSIFALRELWAGYAV